MGIKKIKKKPQQVDQEIQKLFFKTYYQKAYRTAFMIIKDHGVAEDIVQDSFIKAFCNIQYLKEFEQFGAWFAVIVTNTARNFFRDNRHTFPIDDLEKIIPLVSHVDKDSQSIEDMIIDKETREYVFNVIMKLNEKYRDIFIYRYYWDLSYHAIAEELNLSMGTVKSRLNRGKIFLKKELEKYRKEERKDGLL